MVSLHPDDLKVVKFLGFIGLGALGGGLMLFFGNTEPHYFSEAELEHYNYTGQSILVIKPVLTANAYYEGGFYDYFKGKCDESCLNLKVNPNPEFTYNSALRAMVRFEKLGATMGNDYTTEPETFKYYKKIVLLHNEYVTQEFYDNIIKHPNVVYMYPNALYAQVKIHDGNMTLVKGHGVGGKDNAFDWPYDNTRPDELDNKCKNFKWHKVSNGIQLNCFPENFVLNNTWVFGDILYYDQFPNETLMDME